MEHKYGTFTTSQFDEYKKRMHSMVHWLLVYQESNEPALLNYFSKVQLKLAGLNELLEYPPQVVELMGLIEAARIEYEKPDFHHGLYRKMILDAHECIDKIEG